jgi:hypothetical protein
LIAFHLNELTNIIEEDIDQKVPVEHIQDLDEVPLCSPYHFNLEWETLHPVSDLYKQVEFRVHIVGKPR